MTTIIIIIIVVTGHDDVLGPDVHWKQQQHNNTNNLYKVNSPTILRFVSLCFAFARAS